MKKTILLLSFFLLTGCNFLNISPKNTVKDFLNKYRNNDPIVLDELDLYLSNQTLNEDELDVYRKVYIKQYTNLVYEIKDEEVDNDKAKVNVLIGVYDYNKTNEETTNYFMNNQKEFMDNDGDIKLDKYMDYKLNQLLNTDDRITYEITLELEKINNDWEIKPISEEVYEKIHGTYEE